MNSILFKLNKCTSQIEGSAVMSTNCSLLCNTMALETISEYGKDLSTALETAHFNDTSEIIVCKADNSTILMAHINDAELLVVVAKAKTNVAFINLLMKRTLNELIRFQSSKRPWLRVEKSYRCAMQG